MSKLNPLRQICTPRMVLVAGVLVFVWLKFFMPTISGGGSSKTGRIVMNLRVLAGAVQAWTVEHISTGAVEMAIEDLIPRYIDGFKPVAEERYILKHAGESPEVLLTRQVDRWPPGTRFRLNTDGGVEILLVGGRLIDYGTGKPVPNKKRKQRSPALRFRMRGEDLNRNRGTELVRGLRASFDRYAE